jgi:hypothetical protein
MVHRETFRRASTVLCNNARGDSATSTGSQQQGAAISVTLTLSQIARALP